MLLLPSIRQNDRGKERERGRETDRLTDRERKTKWVRLDGGFQEMPGSCPLFSFLTASSAPLFRPSLWPGCVLAAFTMHHFSTALSPPLVTSHTHTHTHSPVSYLFLHWWARPLPNTPIYPQVCVCVPWIYLYIGYVLLCSSACMHMHSFDILECLCYVCNGICWKPICSMRHPYFRT